jgi:hypothetical protein
MAWHQAGRLAQQLSIIVAASGFVYTYFYNFRIRDDTWNEFTILDTEPFGLTGSTGRSIWQKIFGADQPSYIKCARIGLYILMQQTLDDTGVIAQSEAQRSRAESALEYFRDRVQKKYAGLPKPKLSKGKIFLSCVIFLIPLMHAIFAFAKTKITQRINKKRESIKIQFHKERAALSRRRELDPSSDSIDNEEKLLTQAYHAKEMALWKQFFAYT